MIKNPVTISKFLSFILRHHPEKYNLTFDIHGFTLIEGVLKVLKKQFPGMNKQDLFYIVKNCPKNRFHIHDDRIRTRYGHSIPVEPYEQVSTVPPVLFHGTARINIEKILEEGLTSQRRTFVHFSSTIEDAIVVGRRKDAHPVILKIDAERAQNEGISFWKEGNIYLTKTIPAEYISILD